MGIVNEMTIVEELDIVLNNYRYEQNNEELLAIVEQTMDKVDFVLKQSTLMKRQLEASLKNCQIENEALQMKLKAARKLCDDEQKIIREFERYSDKTKWKVEQCIQLLDRGKIAEARRNLKYIVGSLPGNDFLSEDEQSFTDDPSVTMGSILTVSELELTIEEEEQHKKPIMSGAINMIRKSVRSIRSSFHSKKPQKRKSCANMDTSKNKIAKVDQKDDVSSSQFSTATSTNTIIEAKVEDDSDILSLKSSIVYGGKNPPFNSSFKSPDEAPDFSLDEGVVAISPPVVPEGCGKLCVLKRVLSVPNMDKRTDGLSDRSHNFVSGRAPVFRGPICTQCDRRILFSRDKEMFSCLDCKVVSHSGCRKSIPKPCIPIVTPPDKLKTFKISDFAPRTEPMIPALIYHCANEIENRGLNVVGIYRVSGLHSEIEAISNGFMRGECLPRLDRIDVHSLCGIIKSFLIKLKEPLIPISKWKDFIMATYEKYPEDALPQLFQALYDLPQPNRDTLAYFISHLQRISECKNTKMTVNSLATILGPTLVGFSVPNASNLDNMKQETALQKRVIELLVNVPTDYWSAFLNPQQTACSVDHRSRLGSFMNTSRSQEK